MARGDHSQRTPVYGGLLIVGAMIAATLTVAAKPPVALAATVYVIAGVAALVGFVMTFRDYT
jgi:UDP-N-acetylmuramyl pentapeptide phosphotransferase/UDP-N-acetylglucosamine-1-phosphate transferase